MPTPLIWIVTGIYFSTGAWFLYLGRPGYALMFLSYATANLGLLLDMSRGG